jgi:hypothetical protein
MSVVRCPLSVVEHEKPKDSECPNQTLRSFAFINWLKSIGKQQGGKVQITPDRITESNPDDS